MNGECLMKQKRFIKRERKFYSNFNIEDITDADCIHPERDRKVFETKRLG